jgi:adenylylsulfate kinase
VQTLLFNCYCPFFLLLIAIVILHHPNFARDCAQVSKLFADASAISITAFISPYIADRALARKIHDEASLGFIEVFVDTPLHVVEQRDPKGLYKKARAGEIKGTYLFQFETQGLLISCPCCQDFTGISAPYEAPENPEIHLKTEECSVEQSVAIITEYLLSKSFI